MIEDKKLLTLECTLNKDFYLQKCNCKDKKVVYALSNIYIPV